jgi:hypothetical protein
MEPQLSNLSLTWEIDRFLMKILEVSGSGEENVIFRYRLPSGNDSKIP